MEFNIKIINISKNYGDFKALQDINLEIKSGEIFGLLGPNGAGKSSLLRILTSIYYPDIGTITLNGKPFNGLKDPRFIGYLPEERGLYKKMRAFEQAVYFARIKGLRDSEAIKNVKYWFERLDMMVWKNKKVEELSKGMAQKLQIVCTIVHQPSLIILDEPFTGLDPLNADIIKTVIFELSKEGKTIIFSTHRMEQVEEICQNIALINKGKIILNSNIEKVKDDFFENEYILQSSSQNINSCDEFEVVNNKKNSHLIKLKGDTTVNSALSKLISQDIDIESIKPNLPTLNDIFIKLVK